MSFVGALRGAREDLMDVARIAMDRGEVRAARAAIWPAMALQIAIGLLDRPRPPKPKDHTGGIVIRIDGRDAR